MTKNRKDAFSLVGIGAAACIACCAGPILAFLGGLGLAGVASTAPIGTAGLVSTAAAIAFRSRSTAQHDLQHHQRAHPRRCPLAPTDSDRGDDKPMKSIPIYDATADITCTAAADEIPKRIEQVERMRTRLAAIERTDDGLLLHFANRPDIEEELRRFTLDEIACCQFWGFTITSDSDQLHLRWDAPPTLSDYMARLLRFLQGTEPLTAERVQLNGVVPGDGVIIRDAGRITSLVTVVWDRATGEEISVDEQFVDVRGPHPLQSSRRPRATPCSATR